MSNTSPDISNHTRDKETHGECSACYKYRQDHLVFQSTQINMKVLVYHFLFLHHLSLLYAANIDVQQIPEQNDVEVAENMSRILRFRIIREETTKIIIKYRVNETSSHHPEKALNLNALYTSTIVNCTTGSSLLCQELQILVQGKWEIHMTSFHIQVFNIGPAIGMIQEIAIAEHFKVHFTPGASPTAQNEGPTQMPSAASQTSYPTSVGHKASITAQTTTIPQCPNSINMEDMARTLLNTANLPLLIPLGGLATVFAVSFIMNVILIFRFRRRKKPVNKRNNSIRKFQT